MNSPFPLEIYHNNKDLCSEFLASQLNLGGLALIVGSGASVGMGLPNWNRLVSDCIEDTISIKNLDIGEANKLRDYLSSDNSYERLMKAMSRVEKHLGDDYSKTVSECLYRDVKEDEALLNQRLLAVIGALTMNSSRGSISEVLTFNFDDILERYLRLHGFTSQVITELPQLRHNTDVTVYHPHGFLPSRHTKEKKSKNLILSEISFDQVLGDQLDPWQELLRDLLLRKIGIFVGISLGTSTLRAVISHLKSTLSTNRGPTGFWLIGPDDPVDIEEDLLERNIVPIRLSNYSEYEDVLLKICQKASEQMQRI